MSQEWHSGKEGAGMALSTNWPLMDIYDMSEKEAFLPTGKHTNSDTNVPYSMI